MTALPLSIDELTASRAGELHQSLLAAFRLESPIELDLGSLYDIDTAGVQVLIWAQREAERQQAVLHLSNPNDTLLSFLTLCGLNDTLCFTGSAP